MRKRLLIGLAVYLALGFVFGLVVGLGRSPVSFGMSAGSDGLTEYSRGAAQRLTVLREQFVAVVEIAQRLDDLRREVTHAIASLGADAAAGRSGRIAEKMKWHELGPEIQRLQSLHLPEQAIEDQKAAKEGQAGI